VPAGIAAKVLFPERTVISMVGDGGFLMNGQEIATAFHHGVNPLVMVFNNQMYGTIRMHQERDYPGRVSGTALTNPDFAKFIEAYGGHGEVVQETEEFRPAVERALASGKPAVVELRMNPDQITTRTTITAMRAAAGLKAKPAKTPAAKKAKPAATARGRTAKATKPKKR
jgi:acetolactate synthase-1/2/3 large subunit